MQTIQATWGEWLVIEVRRWERAAPGRRVTTLFEAVAEAGDVAVNTVGNLRTLDRAPTGKRARLAALLLVAMGHDPEACGVHATWPDHVDVDRLESTLREGLRFRLSGWAARGSNPEPAESMPDSDMMLNRAA